jgi:hypothetical protein
LKDILKHKKLQIKQNGSGDKLIFSLKKEKKSGIAKSMNHQCPFFLPSLNTQMQK